MTEEEIHLAIQAYQQDLIAIQKVAAMFHSSATTLSRIFKERGIHIRTKDENTEEFFNRFKVVKIQDKPWEVQAVDRLSSDGVLEIALKETYSNPIEDEINKDAVIEIIDKDTSAKPTISGPAQVKPYDIVKYSLENLEDFSGEWRINCNKAKINAKSENSIEIEITTGKSGKLILSYSFGAEILEKEIEVLSL